jgi:hypothetical protein
VRSRRGTWLTYLGDGLFVFDDEDGFGHTVPQVPNAIDSR